jgi:hypothetical protein
MVRIKRGDLVKFIGCDKYQINWGNNDDPNKLLKIGEKYIVTNVDVRSYHTKISLEGIEGRFNSVCFDTL